MQNDYRSFSKSTAKGWINQIAHMPISKPNIEFTHAYACNMVYMCVPLLYPRHLCRGVYSFRLDVCPFVCSFVHSFVRVFVRSLLSVTFVEFTSKFLVKVSLSEYISLTTHQKAFIFEPWVPERVSFYTMSFCPRVDAPGWG